MERLLVPSCLELEAIAGCFVQLLLSVEALAVCADNRLNCTVEELGTIPTHATGSKRRPMRR